MTKIEKTVLCITIPLGALILTCFMGLIIVIFLCLFDNGIFAQTTRDINRYGEFRSLGELHETDYLIFPETLENVKQVNEYIYLYDVIGFGGKQLYLDVTYDDKTFQDEIEYWGDYTYPGTGKKAKLDKGILFNAPTYVFCYFKISYLYMSFVQEENRIIYVFIDPGEADILIPESYMPKNYYNNDADKYSYTYNGNLNNWYE